MSNAYLKSFYWGITIIGFFLSPLALGEYFGVTLSLSLPITYVVTEALDLPYLMVFPFVYVLINIFGLFLFSWGSKKMSGFILNPVLRTKLEKYISVQKNSRKTLAQIPKKYYVALVIFLISLISYYTLYDAYSIYILFFGMLAVLALMNLPSEWLEDGFAAISYRLKISAVFAGGLFLAVASSSPEFFTSLSGVVIHKVFSIGFDTLIWSSLFNLCIIIGVCTFYKPQINVSKKLVSRDLPFYGATIAMLLILAIDGKYTPSDFLLLLLLYVVYVLVLYFDKSKPYKTNTSDTKRTIFLKIGLGLIIVGLLAHFLVSFGQQTVGILNDFYNYSLPVGILACTLYGPGTSVADLFVSIAATKKGEDSAAIVNTISSNTFDLTICLAVPGLIYSYVTGQTIFIDLNQSFLLISMLVLSFILVLFVLWNRKITRVKGIGLIIYYVLCTIIYIVDLIN